MGIGVLTGHATVASTALGALLALYGVFGLIAPRMTVPPRVQVKALRGELETLCAEMNCDLDLESA